MIELFADVLFGSRLGRIVAILLAVALAHVLVRGVHRGARSLLDGKDGSQGGSRFADRPHPKLASLLTLLTSTLTFVLYFAALGMVLGEFQVSLTAYFASATVIGLAVGFGSQGMVQDVVTGLTLIFADVLDVGDMVEISGHIGRVESIGLRFTRLVNYHGVTVFIPNRNIALMGRYRRDVIRSYLDVRVPPQLTVEATMELVQRHARGLREQFRAAVASEPEVMGGHTVGDGAWAFVRVKFRIWPGQQALVEQTFVRSVTAALKGHAPDYAEWMITSTSRVA